MWWRSLAASAGRRSRARQPAKHGSQWPSTSKVRLGEKNPVTVGPEGQDVAPTLCRVHDDHDRTLSRGLAPQPYGCSATANRNEGKRNALTEGFGVPFR